MADVAQSHPPLLTHSASQSTSATSNALVGSVLLGPPVPNSTSIGGGSCSNVMVLGTGTSTSSSSSSAGSSTSTPARQRRKMSTWLNWWRGKAAMASGRAKAMDASLAEAGGLRGGHICTCGRNKALVSGGRRPSSDRDSVSSVFGSASKQYSVLPTSSNSWKEASPDLFLMDSSPCERNPPMETQHACACSQAPAECQGRDLLYLRLNSNSSVNDDLDLSTRLDFMVNMTNADLIEETDCDTALFVGEGNASKSPFLGGYPSSSGGRGNKPFRSKFPSPFRGRKYLSGKGPCPHGIGAALYQSPSHAKNIPYSALSSNASPTQASGTVGINLEEADLSPSLHSETPSISKEELLRLYIQELDEEANYFKASSPSEDDLCDCPKCQTYYIEYYARYLEQYEARREYNQQQEFVGGPLEASLFMEDIMNNGISFCSIM